MLLRINMRYLNSVNSLLKFSKFISHLNVKNQCILHNSTRILSSSIQEGRKGQFTLLHHEDQNIVEATLMYINEKLNIKKKFIFHRNPDENISLTMERMGIKINNYVMRKAQRKGHLEEIDEFKVSVDLHSETGDKVKDNLCNIHMKDLLNGTSNYTLNIDDNVYTFHVIPVCINILKLQENIMAEFLVYPSDIRGVNLDPNQILYQWYMSNESFESIESVKKQSKNIEWESIGEGFAVSLSKDDASKLLKVVATPLNCNEKGEEKECISDVLVSASPGPFPFEKRHKHTSKVLNNDYLRIASYNMLADCYADSDYSRTTLFPNIPAYALNFDYRKHLLLKEILGYKSDLICLQEVDEKAYKQDFQPVLGSFGLDSIYTCKRKSSMKEGLATFYRKEKLQLKETYTYHLSEELKANSLFKDLLQKVELNTAFYESFMKHRTILQVSVFRRTENPNHLLVAGSTHLHSVSTCDHTRLFQTGMCLTFLGKTVDRMKEENPENNVSLVFCGDFNSLPESGVYRLITSGVMNEDDGDWKSKPGEELENISFNHDFNLASACGIPEYTNFVDQFKATIDYIFFQTDKFSIDQVVPFPSKEELTEHVALPSVTFPSDHIALVADLKWSQ